MLVKWFLVGALMAGSVVWLHAADLDQAGKEYEQAIGDQSRGDYKGAAQLFDDILANYPSTQNITVWTYPGKCCGGASGMQ